MFKGVGIFYLLFFTTSIVLAIFPFLDFNLGSIYMNVYKDNNLAKIYFQKAVDLDPDYKLAKDNLKYIENFDD